MKKFALIGVAGYIAPRHMKAIKDTGNGLVAALDKSDSVGIIDSYFPGSAFFTEFERFDRHLEKMRHDKKETAVDYVTIASPNYLHDAHIRFALRIGADAICEKPLVLNPWNIDALADFEREYGRTVHTVLQLRLHSAIRALKDRIDQDRSGRVFDIDLTYITARGLWYYFSWKGDESKSGGIATNIGVHFFDMLSWIFGEAKTNIVHLRKPDKTAGFLELERARIRWFLSLNESDLPEKCRKEGKRTFREVTIDGEPFEFTEGFADLHTRVYENILKGSGFGLEENRRAIGIVHKIRNIAITPARGDHHPLIRGRLT